MQRSNFDVWIAFATSEEVSATFIEICLFFYAVDLTGGLPLILVGGRVIMLGEIWLFACASRIPFGTYSTN